MKVPFVDLKIQYQSLKKELEGAMESCFDDSIYIGGPRVAEFEKNFAHFVGTEYCISCANGSDAIVLALMTIGIGPGDKVAVPALTWMSTATSVLQVGATPVFVDIDPETFTMDMDDLKSKLEHGLKAVIPVHLYGQMADMKTLLDLKEDHEFYIIEDCAQAHGSFSNAGKAGTLGDFGTFSFYPAKNLGAFGDGGAVVTHSSKLAEKLRYKANVGQSAKNVHVDVGICSRLDTLQAAILSVKLPYLQGWIDKRREIANTYDRAFEGTGISAPKRISDGHSYHCYVVQLKNRDRVQQLMAEKGVQCQIHYPKALFQMEPLHPYVTGEFPGTEQIIDNILSLPMYPELTSEQQEYVINCLLDVVS